MLFSFILFSTSIVFFIFTGYLLFSYWTLLITVLFNRTDRLSCLNICFNIYHLSQRKERKPWETATKVCKKYFLNRSHLLTLTDSQRPALKKEKKIYT